MSTVLWAQGLVGTETSTGGPGKYALCEHLDKLDALGRRLGLGSLLEICDTTGVRLGTEPPGLSPGANPALDITSREASWLALPAALHLLEGLLAHLREHRVRFGLLTNDYAQVVAELEETLRLARSLTPPDRQPELSVST